MTAARGGPPKERGMLLSLRRDLRRACDLLAHGLVTLGRRVYRSPQEIRVEPWLRVDGDRSLRLDYDLGKSSVVVDVGGYRGQWTSDIIARYNCRVYCFEPVRRFSEQIARRFERNRRVTVCRFGLAAADSKALISHRDDASSIFTGPPEEEIELRDAIDCFADFGLERIDLIKINIEGGEYELLEHLIESGFVDRIDNIQVQFHDFVPGAADRARGIREALQPTHEITYRYDFVWENWRLKTP